MTSCCQDPQGWTLCTQPSNSARCSTVSAPPITPTLQHRLQHAPLTNKFIFLEPKVFQVGKVFQHWGDGACSMSRARRHNINRKETITMSGVVSLLRGQKRCYNLPLMALKDRLRPSKCCKSANSSGMLPVRRVMKSLEEGKVSTTTPTFKVLESPLNPNNIAIVEDNTWPFSQ